MCLLEFSIAHFFGWLFTRNLMSLDSTVQCQWEFCVISVRKKEQKSGMTNPRLVYGGCPKFGFTISDNDFQNVAPDKRFLLKNGRSFVFCNVCNGMPD